MNIDLCITIEPEPSWRSTENPLNLYRCSMPGPRVVRRGSQVKGSRGRRQSWERLKNCRAMLELKGVCSMPELPGTPFLLR